ncbi:polysaccharide synthesis protein GtrA [Serinicoccus chungangensis]|uniref:Polysaccharide synthesis protein GtrA n=1 Tax=Serinicoccus chungangensis TaxID=767452 RepID=A0A0W8I8P1_9MICO|nr:GtrA family protein [Serinicoccus chungangensis]KUG55685.1 polysaccharide synthesis protein GtrA [Serinicoccus chungangensis]
MRSLLRFVVVGVANTAVYYLLYRLLLLGMPYVAAHLLAWSGAVVFSFLANSLFTFGVRPTWRRFLAYPATTLVNLAFTTVGSVLLVEAVGLDERYATLVMGVAAVPVTFLLTRTVLTAGREPAPPRG